MRSLSPEIPEKSALSEKAVGIPRAFNASLSPALYSYSNFGILATTFAFSVFCNILKSLSPLSEPTKSDIETLLSGRIAAKPYLPPLYFLIKPVQLSPFMYSLSSEISIVTDCSLPLASVNVPSSTKLSK